MLLLRLLIVLIVIAFVVFILSEVIVPLLRRTVLFPMFRAPDEAKLDRALSSARQVRIERGKADELERLLNDAGNPAVAKPTTKGRK